MEILPACAGFLTARQPVAYPLLVLWQSLSRGRYAEKLNRLNFPLPVFTDKTIVTRSALEIEIANAIDGGVAVAFE